MLTPLYLADNCRLMSDSSRRSLRSADWRFDLRTLSSYLATELLQPRDLACGTLFQSSCIILTSPMDCSDDSWRDTFFWKHEHGAPWLLICGTIEKHLLTYLAIWPSNITKTTSIHIRYQFQLLVGYPLEYVLYPCLAPSLLFYHDLQKPGS